MPEDLVDPILLGMLACPESKQPVRMADAATIEKLNAAQASGRLKSRGGEAVDRPLQGGLLREDGAYLYPIFDGIPVMLVDQGIPMKDQA